VLQSIEFAFYVLNQKFGDKDAEGRVTKATITPENTLVIASSVSNGGAAHCALPKLTPRTKDRRSRLIDGVAVAEPNINPDLPRFRGRLKI